MKKPINEYLKENHGGNVSAMTSFFDMPNSSLSRMLGKSKKPIYVDEERETGDLLINCELRRKRSNPNVDSSSINTDELIDNLNNTIKSQKGTIADLIKANQKLHKKIDAKYPSNAVESFESCECEKPRAIANRSGPANKDLCLNCAGWR